MRYFFILALLLSINIQASKEVVSVIVNTKFDIPDDFQSGIEEELTSYGYYLCQENGCHNVFLQVNVDITKKSENVYRFKAKFLDLKNKRAISIKSRYFKGTINDYEKLMSFGKDLTKLIVKNINNFDKKKDNESNSTKKSKANKVKSSSTKNNLNVLSKIEKLNQKQMLTNPIRPIQNKTNTDLFYNSVISHPQIINLR
jgi:hypothetical protein